MICLQCEYLQHSQIAGTPLETTIPPYARNRHNGTPGKPGKIHEIFL
jgi:hypothetical protein